MVKITAAEQNIEKRRKRNEDILRDLWDNIKHTKNPIIQVLEGEEREKGTEEMFEVITENFPRLMTGIKPQIQEAQRIPYRINTK